jgi:TPR repeat protein
MHARGRGVPQSATEALRWYRLAAEQGEADAQFEVGEAYDTGAGVPADREQATLWFLKAARQSHPYALYAMSRR